MFQFRLRVPDAPSAGTLKLGAVMDSLKFTLSRSEVELVSQALDVYGATLMCAPLGLGLDLLIDVRALRTRLDEAAGRQETVTDVANDPESNVVVFARA